MSNSPRGENLTALGAELVGNYALRINFSDGHSTGIYSWDYLREIDPVLTGVKGAPPPFERELVAKSNQPLPSTDRAGPAGR